MTLEIIPAIDLRGGRCVRLKQGDYDRETIFSEDPTAVAKEWIEQGATRLHLVDLDGAKMGEPVNHELIRKIVDLGGPPVQCGGGLREYQGVRQLLSDVQANRVIIGTQALKQPDWFRSLVAQFPDQVVLGIDARDSMVATDGWLEVSSTSAIELASQFKDSLPLTIVYTNIANDGMMQGIDDATVEDMKQLCELGFDVIASGGVSSLDDVKKLVDVHAQQPNLVGAIVGRALYEGSMTLADAMSACE
ncbi:MAG: 1-(5-phosphoribosyl)-5-[(5-phosphoribosylamino)methylideneamino]imidazole-4-carboxamide isomerase [Planctomycetaceae bacterium]